MAFEIVGADRLAEVAPPSDQRATLSRDGERLYFGSNNDLHLSECRWSKKGYLP
ncbi:MAG TPA: hypothetical protein VGO61_21355 [Steroidobacteraceae bacterium]|nr:hypothetical protein [Steroidobacteraceae bacterium]